MLRKSQDVVGAIAGGGLSVSADLGVAACLSQHCSSYTLSWGERNSHLAAPTARSPPPVPPSSPSARDLLPSENLLGLAQKPANVNIRALQKASLLVPVLLSHAFKVLTVLVLIVSQSQQLTFF